MKPEASGLPLEIERGWAALEGGFEIEPGSTGLLHETIRLNARAGERFVLQRVSGVFSPAIHDNIAAVTAHLAARGFATFELVETRSGERSLDLGVGGRWRLASRLQRTAS